MNQKQRDFGDHRFLACVKDPEICKKRISQQMTVRKNFYHMNIIFGILFILTFIVNEVKHKEVSNSFLMMLFMFGFSSI